MAVTASLAVKASMPISLANKSLRGVRRRHLAGGFTLLEILLVMALMAGAMVMVSAALNRASDGTRLRNTAAQMANGLRDARVRALLEQRVQTFTVNPQSRRWQAPGRDVQQLPAPLSLSATTAAELHTPDGQTIVFFPDGASSGGRIVLSQAGQSWRLDVNWLTGRVDSQRVTSP